MHIKNILVWLFIFLPTLNAQNILVIKNINVVDVSKGTLQKNKSIIISEGIIQSIKSNYTNSSEEGVQVIDGTGKYLIPGLWDMHVHDNWNEDFSELYVANGVLGIRNMFTPMDFITPLKEKISKKEKVGPLIIAAGRIVDGPNSVIPGSFIVSKPEDAEAVVDSVIKDGSDFLKVYDKLSRESYLEIVKESKKRGIIFAGHVPASMNMIEVSGLGQKSLEHLFGFYEDCAYETEFNKQSGKSRFGLAFFNEDLAKARIEECKNSINVLKRNGTWICPTLAVWKSMSNIDDSLSYQNDPRLKYMSTSVKEFWKEHISGLKKQPKEKWEIQHRVFNNFKSLVGKLYKEGINIIAGTDVMNPYVYPGFSIHDELELYVESGFSPGEALKTATINPAIFLGKEKELGSVEEGKIANLVLLNANPLEQISNTKKISSVILMGDYFSREELNKLLKNRVSD